MMTNRQLSESELGKANNLLAEIRSRLSELAGDDKELLFAYRRKIYKELSYDERGKPMHRRKLKQLKRVKQNGLCAVCDQELPEKYVVLDRLNAFEGYTEQNTRLIHQACDAKIQESRRYA
jgi:ribosomal protein L44E